MPLSLLLRLVCHDECLLHVLDCAIVYCFRSRGPIAVRASPVDDVGIECDDEAAQVRTETGLVGVWRTEYKVDVDRLICKLRMSNWRRKGGSGFRSAYQRIVGRV